MTYRELLESSHWTTKRTQIVIRDNYKCKACHNDKLTQDLQCAYLDLTWPSKSGQRVGYKLPSFEGQTFLNIKVFADIYKYIIVHYSEGHEYPNVHMIRSMFPIEEQEYIFRSRYVNKLAEFINRYVNSKTAKYLKEKNTSYLSPSIQKQFTDEALASEEAACLKAENPPQYLRILGRNNQSIKYDFAKGLNVHHTYYQLGRLPWEYPDEALETYCKFCHLELHAHTSVPRLDEFGNQAGTMTPCPRCGGAGEFPEYKHVERGICFNCGGARYMELISP
jgi:hypothetical protein